MALRTIFGASLCTAILLSACAPTEQSAEATSAEATSAEDAARPTVAARPDVTEDDRPAPEAAAVYAHLTAADYRGGWALWPGKGEKYEGQEPHGMLLTTYLNGIASQALDAGVGAMPGGAIIVKENYMPDGTLAATTVMYKVDGYNPDAGDWWWAKLLPDGSVDGDGMMEGKVSGCIGCHTARADNDYVMTGELDAGSPDR